MKHGHHAIQELSLPMPHPTLPLAALSPYSPRSWELHLVALFKKKKPRDVVASSILGVLQDPTE